MYRGHGADADGLPAPPSPRGPLGTPGQSSESLTISLPPELVELIAARAAELLADRPAEPEPWIGVAAAAEHLACNRSRIYALVSAKRVPHEHDGARVLFKRSELDAWVASGGGRRP